VQGILGVKKLNSPLCGPFSLYTTSKGCQVKRLAFQGWARALERFSPRLLISSVKRAFEVTRIKRIASTISYLFI
jgi:hypothetical protein